MKIPLIKKPHFHSVNPTWNTNTYWRSTYFNVAADKLLLCGSSFVGNQLVFDLYHPLWWSMHRIAITAEWRQCGSWKHSSEELSDENDLVDSRSFLSAAIPVWRQFGCILLLVWVPCHHAHQRYQSALLHPTSEPPHWRHHEPLHEWSVRRVVDRFLWKK